MTPMIARFKHCLAVLVLVAVVFRADAGGLWATPEEIADLPTSGPAWEALHRIARASTGPVDLSDKDARSNVRVFAKALVAVRTGDPSLRAEVVTALRKVRGTEVGARVLAVARELPAYILAADIIDLTGDDRLRFEQWLRTLLRREFRGGSIIEIHERRPNNWGTHAGASRIAIALYLDDTAELARAVQVFRGWLGEPDGYRDFVFGARHWHPENRDTAGINPPGATRGGKNLDGVLPDDLRRAGPFDWPPPRENYVYEALQGAVTQAQLLARAGYKAWSWGDQALFRAVFWLHGVAQYPARGDDTWIPYLVNFAYCSGFPVMTPSRPGKALGFTDWTHPPGVCRPDAHVRPTVLNPGG